MMRYIALLRAVNLGSHKKIAMPALRESLTALGYTDVTTYLQSGNAVFTAPERETIATEIEDRLTADLGLTTEVILRTAEELHAVIENNPLEVHEPSRFGVLFLYDKPAPGWLDGFDIEKFAPETVHVTDRELYYDLPDGFGRAKLPLFLNRRLKVPATMRNWNTVTKLAELT
jgi:uncharacterized protein (DUF1697 family)